MKPAEVKSSFMAGIDPMVDSKYQELTELIIAKASGAPDCEESIDALKASYAILCSIIAQDKLHHYTRG